MNEQQIIDRLVAAHSAYVARTGKQPYCGFSPDVKIDDSGNITAEIWMKSGDILRGKGASFAEALDGLDASIAAIPSEAERLRNDAAKAVAEAIEKCRAAGYDPEFVNPLVEMSKRISENAITFAPASEARAMIGGAA